MVVVLATIKIGAKNFSAIIYRKIRLLLSAPHDY